MMTTIELIETCATVPSFSSHEEPLHDVIEALTKNIAHAEIQKVPDNNLVIEVRGNADYRPIALTAHLDKINHFGDPPPSELSVHVSDDEMTGQLDDAVGIGICLSALFQHSETDDPPLLVLFSEMEESFGLRRHPHLLRNGGTGLYPQIGAERISRHLISEDAIPGLLITVDTTPLFRGDRGIAVYSEHWKLNELTPTQDLIDRTQTVCDALMQIEPSIAMYNNTNDYVAYGHEFNDGRFGAVPSIALEPAICPYHKIGEKVFRSDIEKTERALISFLKRQVREITWLNTP